MKGLSILLSTTAAIVLAALPAQSPAAIEAGRGALMPTAEQIIEKNVAARGGIEAWRKIEALGWAGHIERANAPGQRVEFLMQQKRPNKTRFQAVFNNQVSTRIFDGSKGWKMRPARDGQPDVQPYNAVELNFARDGQVIDGPLLDYAAKGNAVTLEGSDTVEGHAAWRLSVSLPSGYSQRVWIDAETFLDVKTERRNIGAKGQATTVTVFYRDYRTIEGLTMPMLIETGDASNPAVDQMIIEKVAINPDLPEKLFEQPRATGKPRKGVIVEATAQVAPRTFPLAR
jgi:outer membrane lipoprotein-sorting protein